MMTRFPPIRILLGCACLAIVAGCGPARVSVEYRIPEPQVQALPLAVGLRLAPGFTTYVHKEEINETTLEIHLGPSQSDALRRIAARLFERAVEFDTAPPPEAAALPVLEPAVIGYAYVFPTKGSDFYSVTINYRISLLGADGTVTDNWEYAGYGSVPSRRTGRTKGLMMATAAAVRDASANLAAHLPEQPMIRNLLAGNAAPAAPAGEAADPPDATADDAEEPSEGDGEEADEDAAAPGADAPEATPDPSDVPDAA